MTRAGIENLVNLWIPRLGLSHWQIEVVWERRKDDPPFAPGDDAFTWRARDYEEARMYFDEEKMDGWDLKQASVMVVHELLHLVTRDVEFILDQIEGQVRSDMYEVLELSHRHAVEHAIDRLAQRIVDLGPLGQ